jgi:hypothetical protein
VPVLERFGFALFLYIYQVHRGYGEPLGYALFLLGLASTLGALQPGEATERLRHPRVMFGSGVAFAAAMLVRPNLAVGSLVVAIVATAVFLHRGRLASLVALGAGMSLVLFGLWHNWWFGHRLVPFSVPEATAPNLILPPALWGEALGDLARGRFGSAALAKVASHIRSWNAPSDLYRVPVLLAALAPLAWWRRDVAVATLAAVALSQQVMLFFYNAGGRYSYIAWMLTFLAFLAVWRERLLPAIVQWRLQRNAAPLRASRFAVWRR